MTTTTAPCATAACQQPAAAIVDGWPMCWDHAAPERRDRDTWDTYLLLRTWISRLHHVGLVDTDIAAAVGVSPGTVRTHRQRLGLTANRTDAQRIRDNRRATAADGRITRCSCNDRTWDGHCHRCHEAARSA